MYIMVLNDGETWTSVEGCKIVRINTNTLDDEIDQRIKDAYNGVDQLDDEVVVEF